MSGTVTELKPPKSKAEGNDIAVGMVIEFALEGQSLQFSTCAGRDDDIETINAVLDKIMAAGNRQKLKAELAKHIRNLSVQKRQIDIANLRVEEAQKRYDVETVKRAAEADELQRQINAIIEADKGSPDARERRGEYKISQAANAKIAPLRTMLSRIPPDQAAQDQVRADAIKASEDAIRSYNADIEWTNAEIARCEAALKE